MHLRTLLLLFLFISFSFLFSFILNSDPLCRYQIETVNKAVIDSECDNLKIGEVSLSPKKKFFVFSCSEIYLFVFSFFSSSRYFALVLRMRTVLQSTLYRLETPVLQSLPQLILPIQPLCPKIPTSTKIVITFIQER